MTGGAELDAGDRDDIVESAGEKTGTLDTGWHWWEILQSPLLIVSFSC